MLVTMMWGAADAEPSTRLPPYTASHNVASHRLLTG